MLLQDTWSSLPASVSLSLHSLVIRTDQGFLKDEVPQFWPCLFSFRRCCMHLQSRGGNGSGADPDIRVFLRIRIQFFSKKQIRIGSGSEFVSAPGNNLETKLALHSAETLGIHLKFGRKNAPSLSEVLFLFLCFCFDLLLNLEKIHNQSIVVLIDGQAAIKAFIKCTVTPITVLNCMRNVNQLAKQNHVNIAGVHGNEVTHYVVKSRSKSEIHGPEPFISAPSASCVSTVKDWSTNRWKFMWNKRKDCSRMKKSVGWTSSRITIRQ